MKTNLSSSDFGRLCSRSTELHFPELEDQLEAIRNVVPEAVVWRKGHPPPQYECDEDNQVSAIIPFAWWLDRQTLLQIPDSVRVVKGI